MRRRGIAIGAVVACAAALVAGAASPSPTTRGPLRVLPSNPRYFADAAGRPVYLTGSHVWWNLVGGPTWGRCLSLRPTTFDYPAYLRWLRQRGHNFARLWTIELLHWQDCGDGVTMDLLPWRRAGSATAVDGARRIDFRKPDPRYFARLRDRVAAAQRAGIYVSVMLFEGWSPQFERDGWNWRGNPYNALNNVNGIDGDRNDDGVSDAHTLWNRRITAIQDAYVRRVVDTVNRFDNVLYEIANEDHVTSTAWQYHMIRLIKQYERRKAKRHPVGMTYQHGDHSNTSLLRSPADWIAPFGAAWTTAPPATDGHKVVFTDTDHLCGLCGGADWVWKSFLRGYNPLYMDPLDDNAMRVEARSAMGRARAVANRIDLRRATPDPAACSTRYCLSSPVGFVVYDEKGTGFTVDVGAVATYRVRWIRPASGTDVLTDRRLAGKAELRAPWTGAAVAQITRMRP